VLRISPAWLAAGLLLLVAPAARAGENFGDLIDAPMYTSPRLTYSKWENKFPEAATGLWLQALQRPEADLRCQAAEAVARARRRGVEGLQTTVAPLIAALDRNDERSTVRLSIANALIVLEARDAAPSLFRHAEAGPSDLRDLVEPALARWDYPPARALWLTRLRGPATPRRELVLAMRGLATVREREAADRLREIALSDRVAGPVRMEAARALGEVRDTGLEKDAEGLLADPSPHGVVDRLVAASLLRLHRGDETVRLLKRLAEDPEPSVAALAVARLIELDPALVVPSLDRLLAGPDAKLRALAVDVLFRQPTEARVAVLADRLDDADTTVRTKARQSLHDLAARKEFRAAVIDSATRVLGGKAWRGLEQAALLLTQLDHKPAAGRLVDLLTYHRPEVFVTAGWGLRHLAVPETLPAVLRYVDAELGRSLTASPLPARKNAPLLAIDHQLSQLNQFFGQQKYAPADGVLRKFAPKQPGLYTHEARAAAVWALGLILEGNTDDDLAGLLEGRLADATSVPPEDPRVRMMSAITLGRIRAKDAVPTLRHFFRDRAPSQDPINNACGWAIEQITGEAMPPAPTVERWMLDWFLAPVVTQQKM
jgi:HEAT repeat protein